MPEAQDKPSMFDRIGGALGIDRIVETFYFHMDTMPEARAIRSMHADDPSHTKQVLKRYLCEWTGGPRLYSVEKGHPRLRQRHMGFVIDSAAARAWMACMAAALREHVADAQARQEIQEAMAKLADWMRNKEDAPTLTADETAAPVA